LPGIVICLNGILQYQYMYIITALKLFGIISFVFVYKHQKYIWNYATFDFRIKNSFEKFRIYIFLRINYSDFTDFSKIYVLHGSAATGDTILALWDIKSLPYH